jgi:hypothetical protein
MPDSQQDREYMPLISVYSEMPMARTDITNNEGKSAASVCCQVAALVPNMFCNFYLFKNHKIANNSATTEARETISTYLESLEF